MLVSDAYTVKAFDRATGRPAFLYDLAQDVPNENLKSLWRKLPAPADLRYTLTATEDAVFVRLGKQKLGPREKKRPRQFSRLPGPAAGLRNLRRPPLDNKSYREVG